MLVAWSCLISSTTSGIWSPPFYSSLEDVSHAPSLYSPPFNLTKDTIMARSLCLLSVVFCRWLFFGCFFPESSTACPVSIIQISRRCRSKHVSSLFPCGSCVVKLALFSGCHSCPVQRESCNEAKAVGIRHLGLNFRRSSGSFVNYLRYSVLCWNC